MTITPMPTSEHVDLEQLFAGCYAMTVKGDGFAPFEILAGDTLILEHREARNEMMVVLAGGGAQIVYGSGVCVAVVVGVVRTV